MRRLAGLRDAIFWPFVSAGSAYNRAAERHPFFVGVVTTGIKTSAADLFAQKVMEKRENIDWTRQAAFTFFGFAYLGAFQYSFYRVLNAVSRPITDTMGHIASAPFKTFIDQALHHPFIYFPAFYGLKYVVVKGEDPALAYARYQDELWCNCTALWTIWVPAQMLNFSVVPAHLQIPYVAVISFGWTVVLSTMRGAFDDKRELLEHVEEISTDEAGVPLHAVGEQSSGDAAEASSSRCEHGEAASLPSRAAPSVAIPSFLERYAAREPRWGTERIREEWARRCGGEAWAAGEADSQMDSVLLAATAACTTTGIMALQHPLQWESQRAAEICGWEGMLLRLRSGLALKS